MRLAVLVVVGGGAVLTRAGTGTWLGQVTTTDGDAVVEPGETASIRLSVDMSPDAGTIDEDTGLKVQAFAVAWCDFLATDAWSTGHVTVRVNPKLIFDRPKVDPETQSVLDLIVYQPDTLILTREDPLWIATLDWDPLGDFAPRRAGARAAAEPIDSWGLEDQEFAVWEGADSSYGFSFAGWTLSDALFSFDVVPSPGAAALAPVPAALLLRRRR